MPMDYQAYMEIVREEEENRLFQETVKLLESYFMKEQLVDKLRKKMNQTNINRVLDTAAKFIDSHSRELTTAGPMYGFTFYPKDVEALYDIVGHTPESLVELTKEMINNHAYEGDGIWSEYRINLLISANHGVLITAFLIWATLEGNADVIDACLYMMSFVYYPMLFRKYWEYGVNEAVMEYTIEHLTSKSIIKRHSTLLTFIKYQANGSYRNYYENMVKQLDTSYADFNYGVWSRINAALKKISSSYYDNFNKNAAIIQNQDKNDDGELTDNESISSTVSTIAENTYTKFITSGVNERWAAIAAEATKASKDRLIGYINKVMLDKRNELDKLIENIIMLYYQNNPGNPKVGSRSFLAYALSLYRSIGTSKDQLKREISKILDIWVYDILEVDREYPREATIIAFRRSLFNYVVLMIHQYN